VAVSAPKPLPVRFSARLDAYLVVCSQCDQQARVERGHGEAVRLATSALEAAGWRRLHGAAVCPICAPQHPAESGRRIGVDPSPARQALAQYARHARGDARRWARTLLAEWSEKKIDA